jgi:uncharacterized protein (TIGR02996 family)
MTDADPFLDAIFDNPDDDLPRLVYADWLEEHGEGTYAEFIRLQCAVARLPWNGPEATELWKRISPVWNRLEEEWWPIAWLLRGIDATHFRRGFYAEVLEVQDEALVDLAPLWGTPAYFPTVRATVYNPFANPGTEQAVLSLGGFRCHTFSSSAGRRGGCADMASSATCGCWTSRGSSTVATT